MPQSRWGALPGWGIVGTAPGNGGGGSGSVSSDPWGDKRTGGGGCGKDSVDGEPVDPSEDIDEWDEVEDMLKLDVRMHNAGPFLGDVDGVTVPCILPWVAVCFTEKE